MEFFVTRQSIQHRGFLESYYATRDDLIYKHMMPVDTLEWRAAEYDIDPVSELDLLVDVVLYEQFVEYSPGQHPLFTLDTANAAREAHIAAVMVAKARVRPEANQWRTVGQRRVLLSRTELGPEWHAAIELDGLAGVKSLSRLDPMLIEAKREGIERKVREPLRRQSGGLSPGMDERERLARLYRGGER